MGFDGERIELDAFNRKPGKVKPKGKTTGARKHVESLHGKAHRPVPYVRITPPATRRPRTLKVESIE